MTHARLIDLLLDRLSDTEPSRLLGEGVRRGIEPFDPGEMTTYLHEGLNGRRIVVRVELFPDYPFSYDIDPFDNPVNQMYLAANRAMLHYRNRLSLPVEDHIILGEN